MRISTKKILLYEINKLSKKNKSIKAKIFFNKFAQKKMRKTSHTRRSEKERSVYMR